MTSGDRYVNLVEWSDVNGCFIGSCPELFYGGCHGDDPRLVFEHLREIVEKTVQIYQQDRKPLPEPMTTGRQFVNAMQAVA